MPKHVWFPCLTIFFISSHQCLRSHLFSSTECRLMAHCHFPTRSPLCQEIHNFSPFLVKSCGGRVDDPPSYASNPPSSAPSFSSYSPTKISQLPLASAPLVTNNQNILFARNPPQNRVSPKSENGKSMKYFYSNICSGPFSF